MASSPNADPQWEDWLSQARRGDAEAFGQLVERVSPALLSLAWRVLGNRDDAWDALQAGLLSAWRGIRGYRAEAGFYAWLRAIVMNEAIRVAKKRRSDEGRRAGPAGPDAARTPEKLDPLNLTLKSLESETLWRALRELPLHYRAVFWLREWEGLSYEEIAAALHVPVGTVRSRLAKARRSLKELLGDDRHETSSGQGLEPVRR